MGTIQIKRGLSANLPSSAAVAEILYTTDTKRFYVGNGDGQALTEFGNFAELITSLSSKASSVHTHAITDITNFNDSVDARITTQKGQANGLATLDQDGLIPSSQIPAIFKEAEVVNTIAERNALTPFAGLHALVLNATTDSTVESGGAEYIYDGQSWVKISELGDLDAIITWDNVTNKPSFVSKITDLSDTPSTLTGNGGKLLAVNSAGTAVEFISVYTGAIDGGSF